jgi:hypothetical protein
LSLRKEFELATNAKSFFAWSNSHGQIYFASLNSECVLPEEHLSQARIIPRGLEFWARWVEFVPAGSNYSPYRAYRFQFFPAGSNSSPMFIGSDFSLQANGGAGRVVVRDNFSGGDGEDGEDYEGLLHRFADLRRRREEQPEVWCSGTEAKLFLFDF